MNSKRLLFSGTWPSVYFGKYIPTSWQTRRHFPKE